MEALVGSLSSPWRFKGAIRYDQFTLEAELSGRAVMVVKQAEGVEA
jgi:hypothetical protein